MRKALVVGVDYYDHINALHGCVNDAHSVKSMLDRDSDGSVNFHVKLLTATGPGQLVPRRKLREAIQELFQDKHEIVLLYFAGHGYIEATGGYLCASDCETGDDGIPLAEIMTMANQSPSENKIIILDSCHSGVAATNPLAPVAEISEGVTVLTASTAEQYANEENGSGIFTTLLVDALSGAAANLVGAVTPGSVYAHIDQSLGAWAQRPVFKTNVRTFVSLRKVRPPIELGELRRLAEFFPEPGYEYQLDPSYEPHRSGAEGPDVLPPNSENAAILSILQNYVRVNLVVPVGAPHMWHATMESKTCTLTALGEHYRRLVAQGMI
ncbi:caspase domain-containing protein [Paracoccus mangrovi]|uniref:Caspase domain-containing protein n=1 Tax=Paracoccus mangrovi TaxID=1715645 RepID=A0ABV7RA48_9RHOB